MEDNLKRLVSETLRVCRERGQAQVDAALVAYVATLLDYAKAWQNVVPGATLAAPLAPNVISTLAAHLSTELDVRDDPIMCTARMQVMMEKAFKQQRETIEKEMADHQERTYMLLQGVTQSTQTGRGKQQEMTIDAYERLYLQMIEFVCAATRLDKALGDPAAVEEVRAAMESVFPLSIMARYLTLSPEQKQQQAEELARITLGILLYNQHKGIGGLALPAGTETYLPAANRLSSALAKQVDQARLNIHMTTALVYRTADAGTAAAAKKDLVNLYQGLLFLEQLQVDLEDGLAAVHELRAELQHALLLVADMVGSAAAVPKNAVFPTFDHIGAVQLSLGEELRMLVVRERLFDALVGLHGGFKLQLSYALDKAVLRTAELPPPGAADTDALVQCAASVRYLPPGSKLDAIALGGFCATSLAVQGGLLRGAEPSLGYLECEGQVYGFATADAMLEFGRGPERVLQAIANDVVRRHPVLVKLLGLPLGDNGGGGGGATAAMDIHAVLDAMAAPMKCDFGCQTPVHFVERNIDKDYEWNVWTLRRRALALVNLTNKRTHSTQSHLSHFRRDNESQVWLPKAAAVQTRVNKGQSMPKKLQYVTGLRGAPEVKMKVVRLELDLGQPHHH